MRLAARVLVLYFVSYLDGFPRKRKIGTPPFENARSNAIATVAPAPDVRYGSILLKNPEVVGLWGC